MLPPIQIVKRSIINPRWHSLPSATNGVTLYIHATIAVARVCEMHQVQKELAHTNVFYYLALPVLPRSNRKHLVFVAHECIVPAGPTWIMDLEMTQVVHDVDDAEDPDSDGSDVSYLPFFGY